MDIIICCRDCEHYVSGEFCSLHRRSTGLFDECPQFRLEVGDATFTVTQVDVPGEEI